MHILFTHEIVFRQKLATNITDIIRGLIVSISKKVYTFSENGLSISEN